MSTLITLFFLVVTFIFWMPIAIAWGFLKGILNLILSIFRSFQQPGVDAFETSVSNIFSAILVALIDSFSVVANLWDWSKQNETGAIILSILIVFLFVRLSKLQNNVFDTVVEFNALGATILFGLAVCLAGVYLIVSAVVSMYFNSILFWVIYISLAVILGFKFLIVHVDAMTNRNFDRDKQYAANTLSHAKRFYLKLFELVIFFAILILLVAAGIAIPLLAIKLFNFLI